VDAHRGAKTVTGADSNSVSSGNDRRWITNLGPEERRLLEEHGGRIIAFNPFWVRVTGSVTTALFLAQALYVTKNSGDWWWKTAARWEQETGLTRDQQRTARRVLRNLRILLERKSPDPLDKRIFYRLDLTALVKAKEKVLSSPDGDFPTIDGGFPTMGKPTFDVQNPTLKENTSEAEKIGCEEEGGESTAAAFDALGLKEPFGDPRFRAIWSREYRSIVDGDVSFTDAMERTAKACAASNISVPKLFFDIKRKVEIWELDQRFHRTPL
jgi:hypothetical protein